MILKDGDLIPIVEIVFSVVPLTFAVRIPVLKSFIERTARALKPFQIETVLAACVDDRVPILREHFGYIDAFKHRLIIHSYFIKRFALAMHIIISDVLPYLKFEGADVSRSGYGDY